MTTLARHAFGLCALLLIPLALVLSGSQAGAATGRVTLGNNGPTPQTITINRGDTVTFVNQDNSSHTIASSGGAWSYRATIAPGASATTPPFGAAGQYAYRDTYTVTLLEQTADGTIAVRAPAATGSPTPRPTATKSPTPSPEPSATRSASPSASPTGSPTPGLALGPGVGDVPTPSASGGPAPDVAPLETATPTPTPIAYGAKSALVQDSPHSYGLPILLALLAAFGVLSLLVRLLLAEPTADGAVRRTEQEGPEA